MILCDFNLKTFCMTLVCILFIQFFKKNHRLKSSKIYRVIHLSAENCL